MADIVYRVTEIVGTSGESCSERMAWPQSGWSQQVPGGAVPSHRDDVQVLGDHLDLR